MKTRLCVLSALAIIGVSGAAYGIDVTRPFDTITGSSPNFPAGESPPNAIDNSAATKYLNFDRLNTGFTVIPSGTGVVRHLTIITANDAPARDPASFLLEGSDDGTNFSFVALGNISAPTTRFSIASSSFENSTTYAYYRVTFPTIRDEFAANSMQVAEVQLATKVDITSPNDAVSIILPKGGTTAPNEGVTNLFDNRVNTKLDVQNATAGETTVDVTPLLGETIVTGLAYFSGNDDANFPGRTPSYIGVFGSNDGANFDLITFVFPNQAIANMEDQEFDFPNETSYTQYRLVFGIPFSSTDMQVGEIQLFGTAPNMTPPANDECAAARVVTAGQVSGTTSLAGGSDITPCGVNDTFDVWYRYTSPKGGLVEANTCDSAPDADTTLAVYDTCGGSLIACDDNGCFLNSVVRWNTTPGGTYLIRVALSNNITGAFRLNIVEGPAVHTDTPLTLNYNFNGMTHRGEEFLPDAPNGYRSISDRGLRIDPAAPESIGAGTLLGLTGINYQLVQDANTLDIVHLGDRNLVDAGGHIFDPKADGDNTGVQPDWLPDTNQSAPQVTDLSGAGIVMTPDTRIGVLYQISNGGGLFAINLTFSDSSVISLFLDGPDWFFDQHPQPPSLGLEQQLQLGVFAGTEDVDNARNGASLNVVEAIISAERLLLDGFGDISGRTLSSISFSDATNINAGYAIIAASVRDAADACRADFNHDTVVNSQDFFDFLTAFFSGAPSADFNNDTLINSQDFFDFLTAFFTGC